MKDIKDLVGRVGSFEISNSNLDISFPGTIIEKDKIYVINGTINEQQAKHIPIFENINVVGTVCEIDVTLLNAYIICDYSYIDGRFSYTLIAKASEIIIGRRIKDNGMIIGAQMEFPEINGFFSDALFKGITTVSQEQPFLLEYCFPDNIVIEDELGTLIIYRNMNRSWNRSQINFVSVPMVSYKFSSPLSISTAIKAIAKVRNLFLFFADGYLPLHNILLSDINSPKIEDELNFDYYLLLNSKESYSTIDEPFFITTNMCSQNIQTIWDRWSGLSSHKFITALYFEIIRNRSTWINQFLNFAQAIELYESTYRLDYLRKNDKNRDPVLQSCYEDAFQQLSIPFSLETRQIINIAKEIKEARNFFTHYNIEKYDEPSVPEVFAMSRVLHLVFIGLIYKHLGFSDETVKNTRNYREFSFFQQDVSVIQKEPIPNVDYSDYF